MARKPKKDLADLAARRRQTIAQLIADWGISSYEGLVRFCDREGVSVPSDLTLSFSTSELTLTLAIDVKDESAATESAHKPAKKSRKGKVTLDASASHEHDGVDTHSAAEPKDPA